MDEHEGGDGRSKQHDRLVRQPSADGQVRQESDGFFDFTGAVQCRQGRGHHGGDIGQVGGQDHGVALLGQLAELVDILLGYLQVGSFVPTWRAGPRRG